MPYTGLVEEKPNTVKVSVSIGEKPTSLVGLDALLSFQPSLIIDGLEITQSELEESIARTEELALIKVCDHPDQYLVQNLFDHTTSGRFAVLNELC